MPPDGATVGQQAGALLAPPREPRSSVPDGPLRPRPGVLAARELDAIALYDPGQERYVTLNPVATRVWELLNEGNVPRVIAECLSREYTVPAEQVIPDVAAQLESWLRDRLIEPGRAQQQVHSTPDFAADRDAQPARSGAASGAAKGEIRVPSVLRCGVTIGWLRWLLRIRCFEGTIAWIRSGVEQVSATEEPEPEIVRRFEYALAMAGAFYPGRARCLEQSLALYYLCRRQGIAVRYCQGVRLFPFEAHAWIEYRGKVMNDLPEHVKLFARFPDQLP
jgi:hypothetical protein